MKVSIRSMKGSINEYRPLLEPQLDFDKHYNVYREFYHSWHKRTVTLDELKDVEIKDLEQLFAIFKHFKDFETSFREGELVINMEENAVYLFNHWVE